MGKWGVDKRAARAIKGEVMTMKASRIASFGFAAALSALVTTAHADDRASAQLLFEQGRELIAAGHVAEACSKFEGAAQLSQTPGVRLNLSDCYDKLGRTASAYGKADEALALAERLGDGAAAELARERLATLKPKLSFVKVRVPKASAIPGLELARDGEKLPEAAYGTPMPADPGEHVITARAPGRVAWTAKQTLGGPGAQIKFTVPLLEVEKVASASAPAPGASAPAPTAPPPVAPASPEPANGEERGTPWGTQRTLGLVAGGVGLVGVGIGAVFGAKMLSKKSEYQEHTGSNGQCADAACAILNEDARAAGNVATIGWIAGGVLVATGAVLWFTTPGAKAPVGVTAAVGPASTGLELRGMW